MKKSDLSKAQTYALLDSGLGRKLEQFGRFLLSRPCAQAVWTPKLAPELWRKADAIFERESDTKWHFQNPEVKKSWTISAAGLQFKLQPTDFGHLGIFPEQQPFWDWLQTLISEKSKERSDPIRVLNLFAYSGGASLAAAKAGAHVCHLDASKGMVEWARENAALNHLQKAHIRWIVDDARKFLARELRRGIRYDGIIMDPPTFGRGSQGEIFKIEEHLPLLLRQCQELLSPSPLFILLSCHTPGFTPTVLKHLLVQMVGEGRGKVHEGEMLLTGDVGVFPLPSGTFAQWLP